MVKQIAYTKITPLPSNVPRQLVLDLLHSHEEIIRLNNLVSDVHSIPAPQNAEKDDYFAQWYEITEYIPIIGIKKRITFKGCWYDQEWGVQSHTIMGKFFEMRNSYRVGGNQPGEPREQKELGINKPEDGLYLREDIRIDVFVPIPRSFVEKEMQEASKTMIERMKRKAELLDEGRMVAMFEDGKLKTTSAVSGAMLDVKTDTSPPFPPPGSPGFQRHDTNRSSASSMGVGSYHDINRNSSASQPYEAYRTSSRPTSYVPVYQQPGYQGPPQAGELVGNTQNEQHGFVNELPGSTSFSSQQRYSAYRPQEQRRGFTSELPGDTTIRQPAAG